MNTPRTHFADNDTLAYIAKIEAELAAAQERLKALEGDAVDAARYRKLRSTHDNHINNILSNPDSSEAAIDAAIDASIAKEADRG